VVDVAAAEVEDTEGAAVDGHDEGELQRVGDDADLVLAQQRACVGEGVEERVGLGRAQPDEELFDGPGVLDVVGGLPPRLQGRGLVRGLLRAALRLADAGADAELVLHGRQLVHLAAVDGAGHGGG
jgi:hypothetical protein